MKKTILYLLLMSLSLVSCSNDNDIYRTPEISIAERNALDDQAIQTFLENHYFGEQGELKVFDTTAETAGKIKLAELDPQTLTNGTIYVVNPNVPDPIGAEAILIDDKIRLMHQTTAYLSSKNETTGKVVFSSPTDFGSTVSGKGTPAEDPLFYYARKEILDKNPDYGRSHYEIEGFGKALREFKSWKIPDEDSHNLQGVIIVPSREAFARDAYVKYDLYTNQNLRDRSFVFNFQVYNREARQ